MAPNARTSTDAWRPNSDSELSSTPLSTPIQAAPAMLSDDVPETSFTSHTEDKLPHDASVFVGSLPSNIDQGDLTRMLMDHLSEHTQVKNIKVVRDSKGGVCAFVQCENALSATALIQTLHSGVPKPFLGRILRYEPARAFRTLLVSYRTPTKIVRPDAYNGVDMNLYASEVKLELPHAMRIWKHRNSRFHNVLYNSDAIQAEESRDQSASDASGCALDNAIFLHPLNFSKETLQKLLSYFGRLEKFSPLQSTNVDVDKDNGQSDADESQDGNVFSYTSYPAPHNGPRSSSMAGQCWEVKWEHRDDCVSALMTLKRVPHLTVTWAHQPASASQGFNTNYQVYPSYSYHAQHRMLSPHTFASPNRSIDSRSYCQPSKTGIEMDSSRMDRLHISPSEQALDSQKSTTLTTSAGTPTTKGDKYQFSWADGDCSSAPGLIEGEGATGKTTDASDHQNHSENSLDRTVQVTEENEDQELYMPQTPALDKISITPVTPGSHFPITPTSYAGDELHHSGFDDKEKVTFSKGLRPDREIDPTTLFVGGLEMFGPGAWDEEKVKNFFTRFGGLESVKVVRPLNACAAFAFVKFNNAEAPAQAIREEHNRVHEGRAMRVQLRDCNPPRNSWKYSRGRGRHHQNQYGVQRRFHHRFPYDAQGQVSFQSPNDAVKQNAQVPENVPASQMLSLNATLSSVNLSASEDNDMGWGPVPPTSSSDITSVSRNTAPSEKYREWYDEPDSSTHTPEPSLGSSVSVAGPVSSSPFAYPVPHGQFFPPQPWVQSYISQPAYQVPYYPGYPVYPPPVQQSPHQGVGNPPGIEVNGPPAVAQPGWPQFGVYASYIPYPAVFPRGAVVDQAQISNQAPLIPTGFIQNEQGTLIPVYQPEVLDQYMAGAGGPAAQNRHPNAVPQRWNNTSPYDTSNGQSNALVPPNLNRPKPVGVAQSISQSFSDFQLSPVTMHGNDAGANGPMPLYRRQGQRREINQNYNSVRHHSHPRSHSGRVIRGHMHNSGQIQPPDLGHSVAGAVLPVNSWNKFNGAR